MVSKRNIQFKKKQNKSKKKIIKKQKGGFGGPLGAGLSAISSLGFGPLTAAKHQIRFMMLWARIQSNLPPMNPRPDPKTMCGVVSQALGDLQALFNEDELKPIGNIINKPLEELRGIINPKGLTNFSECPPELDSTEKIMEKVGGQVKEKMKEMTGNIVGYIKENKELASKIKVAIDFMKEKLKGDAVKAMAGPIKAATNIDVGDFQIEEGSILAELSSGSGDSGAASTGSSSAPGSQFKDNPEEGVELAKKKIAIHKEAGNEAKVTKYEKSLEKYKAMVSGGGRTKRNKKNKKRKTIKIKCL
jgi:hypothetical protein